MRSRRVAVSIALAIGVAACGGDQEPETLESPGAESPTVTDENGIPESGLGAPATPGPGAQGTVGPATGQDTAAIDGASENQAAPESSTP